MYKEKPPHNIFHKVDLTKESAGIKQILKENGHQENFSSTMLKRITNNQSLSQSSTQTQAADVQQKEIRVSINLPYVEWAIEKLQCILK